MNPWSILVAFASWLPAAATVPEPIRAAVEHVESHGHVDAVSQAGCIGVMQVCPRWSIVSREALFVPEINRLEGARILAYDYNASGGRWRRALAGYLCGNRGLHGKCGASYARRVLAIARKAR